MKRRRRVGGVVVIALLSVFVGAACRPPASSAQGFRRGCRLNVATHVGTCPCALISDLVEMPDRPDLETLRIRFGDDADPRGLERLTHLRTLEVAHPTSVQLRAVAALSRIEHLKITGWRSPDLRALAGMQQLRSLTLYDVLADEVDLTPLAGLTKLRELSLEGRPVRFVGASSLEPTVKLDDRIRRASEEPSDTGSGGGICAIDPSACPSGSDLEDWRCAEEGAPQIYAVQQ